MSRRLVLAILVCIGVLTAPALSLAHPGNGNGQGPPSSSPDHSQDPHGNSGSPPGQAGSLGSADHSQGNAGTSGSYDQPQPQSNADQNPGGANGQCPGGPYCSTRDGSPSGNGNGNGQAVGKPCAGCVGRADNKNPHGQLPNGSDHNAGYECDTNSGIGQTNPAHTGCTSSPPPPASPPHTGPGSGVSPLEVAAMIPIAESSPGHGVLGEHGSGDSNGPNASADTGETPASPTASGTGETENHGLPFTGLDVLGLLAVGAVAIGLGLLIRRLARRPA